MAKPNRQARSAARLAAVQALYQMEMTGVSWRKARAEFEEHRLGMDVDGETLAEADVKLYGRLLEGVVERQSEIDKAVNQTLKEGWPLRRIDPILRALFRAAGFEMLALDTPRNVVLNEYVEVAKAFFDGDEPRLANAVLEAIDKVLRTEKPES
jgi:N utilization substance protein B